MPGREMWGRVELPYVVGPPKTIRPRGRPKKKRIRDPNEKRKSRHKCTRCSQFGHHKNTCKNSITETSSQGSTRYMRIPTFVNTTNSTEAQTHTGAPMRTIVNLGGMSGFPNAINFGGMSAQTTSGGMSFSVGGLNVSGPNTQTSVHHSRSNVGGRRSRTLGIRDSDILRSVFGDEFGETLNEEKGKVYNA
ncbi:hypothetical protein QJS10_CPB20g00814 [Acorus calamus]|uniref:Uncharacterized protein n=1 Tax=Acorus calamus TaxID=4465 RepID=A0AAV9CB08_ACOCL|nr:hypothetical protein QJS10_CPB20g00814 [Acorus calamus]